MTRPARLTSLPVSSTAPEPTVNDRRRYEDAFARAAAHASRYVTREQALDIAHDVASEMLGLSADRVTGALIYVAVTSRLRNLSRSSRRRAAAEGAYQDMRSSVISAWASPGVELELNELERRIRRTLSAMPDGMRRVFLLVRDQELSYRDVAERLGVGVGTVHTQLSRANALLRECVARYEAGLPEQAPVIEGRTQ